LVDIHQKELHKNAAEVSDSKQVSAAYLSCYRKAIKNIEEGLDKEM
jgi:hypothetical protein